jgi:hypothetical protein
MTTSVKDEKEFQQIVHELEASKVHRLEFGEPANRVCDRPQCPIGGVVASGTIKPTTAELHDDDCKTR